MTASSLVRPRIAGCAIPRLGMAPEAARAARLGLEAALAGYKLSFPKVRDPRVEWSAFPSMIGIYWPLVEADPRGLPPTQAAFADSVVSRLRQLPDDAVRARAHRAHPAFVRQHHFELILRERFPLVLRGHVLDLAGLDFLIIEGGSAYGLGLSVDTTTAHDWVRRKQLRHVPMPDVPILELYADQDRHRVGAFWLHHPDQADEVGAFIERRWHQANRYC